MWSNVSKREPVWGQIEEGPCSQHNWTVPGLVLSGGKWTSRTKQLCCENNFSLNCCHTRLTAGNVTDHSRHKSELNSQNDVLLTKLDFILKGLFSLFLPRPGSDLLPSLTVIDWYVFHARIVHEATVYQAVATINRSPDVMETVRFYSSFNY